MACGAPKEPAGPGAPLIHPVDFDGQNEGLIVGALAGTSEIVVKILDGQADTCSAAGGIHAQ